MTPVIEGGTAAHRRLLEETFVGLGATEIERVRFGSHVVRAVPGDLPTPEAARRASGLSLELVDPTGEGLRVDWEMHLVGAALRERALREGIEEVVLVATSRGGGTLQWTASPEGPMTPSECVRLEVEVASAATAAGAQLEAFDLACPLGNAWAARLYVEEPHALLRLGFESFILAVGLWDEKCCRQRYIEIVDEGEEPALISATFANGGSTRLRRDLTCCNPFLHIGPMFASPPPRCPVFG
jgi:hypothetical protein